MKNLILAFVVCAATLFVTESAEAQYYRGGRSFSGSSFSRGFSPRVSFGYSPRYYGRSAYGSGFGRGSSYYGRSGFNRYGASAYRGSGFSYSPRYRSYRY